MSLQQALEVFAHDPRNADANYNLALIYDAMGQSAGAVSFYLRAAEKTSDPLLSYECLLRLAKCFEGQGSRNFTTRGLIQHAISVLPNRPEAYFILSRHYEYISEWRDSYMVSCIGLLFADSDLPPLRNPVYYPGKYGLLFQKGVASWWVGLTNQARHIMKDLKDHYKMDHVHTTAVDNNIKNIGYPAPLTLYDATKIRAFRYKFPGLETISQNHSQAFQDMFVLAMLNGKRNGTYLEVGSSFPFHTSNTALLETKFDWKGISMDIDKDCVAQFFKERKNTVLCLDATKVNFEELLDSSPLGRDIDYLQLDADPPEVTLEILHRIPFHKYRFAVITYEHDSYRDPSTKPASREYLQSHGYQLVVSDISFNEEGCSFEDWWVHPALVNPDIVQRMVDVSDGPKFVVDYIFRR